MVGNLRLDFGDADERLVPARLKFTGDKTVGGISGVILTEGTIRRITRRFKIAFECFADLITLLTQLGFGNDSRLDCSGLDDLEDRRLNSIINCISWNSI
jgi:hypothetical protein